MASSSPENDPTYFGFTDLHGFKDFLVYVYTYAPDLFPLEDWQATDEQMNLDRAFAGLRHGLELAETERGLLPSLLECRRHIDVAYLDYKAGRNQAGQRELEKVEKLLKRMPTQ